jgi:hypothetical protein
VEIEPGALGDRPSSSAAPARVVDPLPTRLGAHAAM